ncbi:MAG: response regulator transcription factor [Pirellulaceae bacterium]|nr:response regulator transcription factor [Pirellulaceae bacterium]
MAIRLMIADDHQVVRSGLMCLLEGSEVEVVAEAADGNQAVEKVREVQPDVVLMDVRMPEADGLEALEKIREEQPDTRVIMLSTYDNPTYIARSVALGAYDFLSKECTRAELLNSIQRTAEGRKSEAGSAMDRVVNAMRKRPVPSEDMPTLTRREHQVLRHLALGLSNREIGRSLEISVETVKEHVQNVLRKLNVGDRTEAAVWAVRRGMA